MSLILVDMDGVTTDWGTGYNEVLDSFGPVADNIPRHKDQKTFNMHEGLSFKETRLVDEAMATMDYYGLAPIEGAVDALHSMLDYGHDVMICTSPWLPNKDCIRHKIDWLDKHLGHGWAERVIVTKDKTMVHGDWLIDDKPSITGRKDPTWYQVVFTQPYNINVNTSLRLNGWAEWDNEDYDL